MVAKRIARLVRRKLQGVRTPVEKLDRPIVMDHAPTRFTRRYADFTANVCGRVDRTVSRAEYRLNGGPAVALEPREPRVERGRFTIDMADADLVHGLNRLDVAYWTRSGERGVQSHEFQYSRDPIDLPRVTDWAEGELDVQDGSWERVWCGAHQYVRPAPGTEAYDRIIVASGAIEGGREVACEMVYRGRRHDRPLFGFGVLPLWGGRPVAKLQPLALGWAFALGWYYSKFESAGMECSIKSGAEEPRWICTYRNFELRPNEPISVRVQAGPVKGAMGEVLFHRQRMKWWYSLMPEPAEWMELVDLAGPRLPAQPYGVALIAHQCQVEFGPVSVRAWSGNDPGRSRT